jgi:hypothetical protein
MPKTGSEDVESGVNGREVPSGWLLVPGTIELSADRQDIHWHLSKDTRGVEPNRSMLDGFFRLAGKDAGAVLRFAKQWGVLKMGPHLYPCSSAPDRGSEPVKAWEHYARRALAIATIAGQVRNNRKPGSLDDWSHLALTDATQEHLDALSKYRLPAHFARPDSYKEAARMIQQEVNSWLEVWRYSPYPGGRGFSDFSLVWNPDAADHGQWELNLDSHGALFPALALQLAVMVAGAKGLYVCSYCAVPYFRSNKAPRADQSNYCESCTGRAKYVAKQNYRKRLYVQRDSEAGLSVDEIAKKHQLPTEYVNDLIKKWKPDASKKTRSK